MEGQNTTKDKRRYLFWISSVCLLLATLSYIGLINQSFEATEKPVTTLILSILSLGLSLLASWKDFYKVVSLLAFVTSVFALFTFIAGRVSYLAFYFSGDVMNTGLSILFIISGILWIASVVLNAIGMNGEHA